MNFWKNQIYWHTDILELSLFLVGYYVIVTPTLSVLGTVYGHFAYFFNDWSVILSNYSSPLFRPCS